MLFLYYYVYNTLIVCFLFFVLSLSALRPYGLRGSWFVSVFSVRHGHLFVYFFLSLCAAPLWAAWIMVRFGS